MPRIGMVRVYSTVRTSPACMLAGLCARRNRANFILLSPGLKERTKLVVSQWTSQHGLLNNWSSPCTCAAPLHITHTCLQELAGSILKIRRLCITDDDGMRCECNELLCLDTIFTGRIQDPSPPAIAAPRRVRTSDDKKELGETLKFGNSLLFTDVTCVHSLSWPIVVKHE